MIESLSILVVLLLQPPVGPRDGDQPRSGTAEVLAAELFKASPAERAILLDRPEFTTPEIVGALMAMGKASEAVALKALGQGQTFQTEIARAASYFDLVASVARRARLDRELGTALLAAAYILGEGADGNIERAEAPRRASPFTGDWAIGIASPKGGTSSAATAGSGRATRKRLPPMKRRNASGSRPATSAAWHAPSTTSPTARWIAATSTPLWRAFSARLPSWTASEIGGASE
jgi:hypothetical protein